MRFCYFDSETVSDIDLKRAGTVRYTEDCEPLSYHFILPGTEKVWRWEAHRRSEPEMVVRHGFLREMAADPEVIFVATNALFDRNVLVNAGGPAFAPLADIRRWVCTAALCRYAGLPGGLERSAVRLGLPDHLTKMDDSGGIQTFCIRGRRGHCQPWEDPERWTRFMAYGDRDVATTRAVHRAVAARLALGPGWTWWCEHEERYYWHDQQLNETGFRADPVVLDSALALIEKLSPVFEQQMAELTGGEVLKLQSPKLKPYLQSEFLMQLPNLQKATLEAALEADLDPRAEQLIRLRLHGAKNSLAKYGRMDTMMSKDQRVRGGYLYYGAHTGRPAGQGVQPTNLTRPLHDLDPIEVAESIGRINGDPAALEMLYDEPPMEVLVSGIRGAIIAGPGKKLVIGDYANIESRYTSWLFGDEERLDYFRRHDDGLEELDLYEMAALRALGDAGRRQEGKSMELGLGFGMGSVKYAAVSGQPFIAADRQVKAWREAFPRIPAGWTAMATLFHAALGRNPYFREPLNGEVYDRLQALGMRVERDKQGTSILVLPSGRPLFYPELRWPTYAQSFAQCLLYGNRSRIEYKKEHFERRHGRPYDPERDGQLRDQIQLVYRGHHGNQRFIHGGLCTENAVQAGAGCIFRAHGLELEDSWGYSPVMETYDEFVFEVDEAEAERCRRVVTTIMETPPDWCADLPLKADVKVVDRYTK